MNALYQHTLLFASITGFVFVAIAWLLLGTVLALVSRRTSGFWVGGSFGAAVVGLLLTLNSFRLGLVEKQLDAGLGIAVGAVMAALLARYLRIRSEARSSGQSGDRQTAL